MSESQILMHRYFDAAWRQGRKGKEFADTPLPEHNALANYIAELEQRLAAANERIAELEEALKDALWKMEDWAGYASEYMRKKHGLADDLAEIYNMLRKGRNVEADNETLKADRKTEEKS